MQRNVLPNRRANETFEMRFGTHRVTYTVTLGYSYPPDRRVREVFISGATVGTEMDAVTRDGAILLSLALQHDVPLETMANAITRNSRNEADSIVGAVIDKVLAYEKAKVRRQEGEIQGEVKEETVIPFTTDP